MKKSLNAMIKEFLKYRSKSKNSGWAEVAEGDIDKLYAIVLRILEMKYEKDCDNSLPVEVDFVDRTRFERLHHFLIPYEHMAKSNDERMEILSRLNSNVQSAVSALNQHIRMLDHIRHEENRKEEGKKGWVKQTR